MIKKEIDYFDLKEIAESGQTFRWKNLKENTYLITAFSKSLEVTQENKTFYFDTNEEDFDSLWSDYFDLNFDYSKIEKLIMASNDSHLKEAFSLGRGIRILKQDLWETIISFLISQNNNIKRISRSIELICEKASISLPSDKAFAFPTPFMVEPGFFLDSALGLGYRDAYLENIYDFTRKNPSWLEDLKKADSLKAYNMLIKIKGIGPKVANCILLFGLHQIDAFPIDTHVKALLNKYYPQGFDFEYYKGSAGIIQQYLFNYEIKKRTH